ncbi:uncharacterized protein LOC6559541 [Drosophila grimshawi]|uniref:GH22030 n=1 Tax=Drosophila grimshawi TaxID=7222 RepID=B4J9K4_DROGR|nr:uncharacterized protein LOC6559541 [Drosophila grimshawi]EDW02511.1 GH22030 [Drosophila grimshawi]
MERSHSCSNFEASHQAAMPHATAAGGGVGGGGGSSDNLPHLSHFPPNKPLRKRRKLQRQQPVLMDMDSAYAADLEDADLEAEAEEGTLMLPHLPHNTNNSLPGKRQLRHEESFDSNSTAPEMSPQAVRQHRFSTLLLRDSSISMQSDSSRYSSVDSLLESRKPDPEAILINLGFGPIGTEDMLARIPKRFLKPSKVPGIDTEAFVKRLQMASSLADSSALGYRGLTSSSDQPPSSIVAKIMERFEVNNQRKQSMGNIEHTIR